MFQAQAPQWYVVYSQPHREEIARLHFRLKGLECFSPRLLLPGPVRRNNRAVSLFPNYLFVRIDLSSEYHQVIWSPGVKYLISAGGNPLPLNDDVVQYLRQRTNSDEIIIASSNLKVGQKVQIGGGPFDGLEGILQDPPDSRGRVKVLMTLLNRQVKVALPVHLMKHGWVVAGSELRVQGRISCELKAN
jgi:transcriptional antiterminator NusG